MTSAVRAEGRLVSGRDGPSGAGMRLVGARVLPALPWLLVLAVATVALLQTGTPVLDVGRYTAYWAFGVTLPGLLVARATIGTRGNWPEDVAIGAVTGLALELVCFALWSTLGLQQQLWLWPLLVVVTFVAVPRLRRHWRISSPQPLPPLWSWGVAGAVGVAILGVRQSTFTAPLPPAGGLYYQDVTWHLSIVHELTRSFPPQISQVAGEVLRYHWFSHVHLASAHLLSGAPEATVVLRLWIIPLLAVTALIGARLAMELSGRWWSGPVAAWGLVVFQGTDLLPLSGEIAEGRIVLPLSPTHVYVVPLLLGVATLLVRALRGVRPAAGRPGVGWAVPGRGGLSWAGLSWAGWVVLALLLVAAAGAKPTAMPLVLAGTCLAGLNLVVQRRRQWLAALSVVGMVAVILPVSFLAVSGSDGGSRISLFDFMEWSPLYRSLTGAGFHPSTGPILPEGVSDLSGRSVLVLALLLLVPLLANVGHLAPLAMVGSRQLRRDPAAWFMVGVVLAAWGVYLVLSHPGLSQVYFRALAHAVAAVFGAWALAAAIPRTAQAGRRVSAVAAIGLFIGAAVVVLARAVTPALPTNEDRLSVVVVSFVVPLAVLGAALAVGLATWPVVCRKRPGAAGWGTGLLLAALVLGGPAEGAFRGVASDVSALVSDRPVPQRDGYQVSPGAGAALAWVEQHTANDAVVATNRHCVQGPERPGCHSLAFWVSGLGGRRTVLEGWGYTSAADRMTAPSPFQERLAANEAVFTDPSAKSIDFLRQNYGASWLVADTSAGPVSGELDRFADKRFSRGPVTVYQLR